MPRSNWKGFISFGLVSIPISLYPAQNKTADISFHQVDKRDNARIKYQRVNVNTGKVVPWERITRAYEYDEETNIPVPDDVLKRVAGDSARTIAIETFIDRDSLDAITITNSYYLTPGKGGDKGYVILREALEETNKIGIAKVIISTKEYLAAVIPHEKALVLCLLRYAAEMRSESELELPTKELSAYKINKKEMEMAKKLIKSMAGKWRPEKFKDEYQDAIHQWVEETVKELPHAKTAKKKHAKATNAVNFVDLLRKSLDSSSKAGKTKRSGKPIPHKGSRGNHTKHVTRH
jgi:DNA end-binding protein Ku